MHDVEIFNLCVERLINMCSSVQECKIKGLHITQQRIDIINRFAKTLKSACSEEDYKDQIQALVDYHVNSDQSIKDYHKI